MADGLESSWIAEACARSLAEHRPVRVSEVRNDGRGSVAAQDSLGQGGPQLEQQIGGRLDPAGVDLRDVRASRRSPDAEPEVNGDIRDRRGLAAVGQRSAGDRQDLRRPPGAGPGPEPASRSVEARRATAWVGLSIMPHAHLQSALDTGNSSGDLAFTLTARRPRHHESGRPSMRPIGRAEADSTGAARCTTATPAWAPRRVAAASRPGRSDLRPARPGLDPRFAYVCGVIVAPDGSSPRPATPLRTITGCLRASLPRRQRLGDDLTALRDLAWRSRRRGRRPGGGEQALGAYGGGRCRPRYDRSMAVSSALNARGTAQLMVAAAGLSRADHDGEVHQPRPGRPDHRGHGWSTDPAIHAAKYRRRWPRSGARISFD